MGKYKPKYKHVWKRVKGSVKIMPPTKEGNRAAQLKKMQHQSNEALADLSQGHTMAQRLPAGSQFSHTKGFGDTFGSRWSEVKVIKFDTMTWRNLLPDPKTKRVTDEKENDTLTEGFVTAKSTGWTMKDKKRGIDAITHEWKTGIDFAKQTDRSNWLLPNKNSGTGLEYKNIPKGLNQGGRTMISFDKTLPREQFQDLMNSEGRTSRKKRYFFMGQIKSLPQVSSLLDFNNMTGRDNEVNIRAGFTPLEVLYF